MACNLVNTAYTKGRVVYLCTENDEQSKKIDEMLWSFAANSFVPHVQYAEGQTIDVEKFPVCIGSIQPTEQFRDVLVSIRSDVPEYFSQFQRIMEPVSFGHSEKEISNLKFQQYLSMTGTEPTVHYIE